MIIPSNSGYQGWVSQAGVTMIIFETDCCCICRRQRPISANGGNAYAVNWLQSSVKASTASAIGSGFQLTNHGSCAVSLVANRSITKGPHFLFSC